MSLSKPCAPCMRGLPLRRPENNSRARPISMRDEMILLADGFTGETKKCLDAAANVPGPADFGLTAAIIVGAFVVGGVVGIVLSRSSKKKEEMVNIVDQKLSLAIKNTIEQNVELEQRTRNVQFNSVGVKGCGSQRETCCGACGPGGCACRVVNDQKVGLELLKISMLDAELNTKFMNEVMIKFVNDIKNEFKKVTDPLTEIIDKIGQTETTLCNMIKQDFKVMFDNLVKINIKNASSTVTMQGNTLTVWCGCSNTVVDNIQDIWAKISKNQTMKVISDTVTTNKAVITAELWVSNSYSYFSTGVIVIIVIFIILLIAAYVYLKSVGVV